MSNREIAVIAVISTMMVAIAVVVFVATMNSPSAHGGRAKWTVRYSVLGNEYRYTGSRAGARRTVITVRDYADWVSVERVK